jgi:two-component system, chemotaxis family, protein-glutamate methylesterase/glutaminase
LITAKERIMSLEPQTDSFRRDDDKGNGGEIERPVAIICPDCGGALRHDESGTLVKYTCHIGHTYTAKAMAAAQFDDMEKVMRSEYLMNAPSFAATWPNELQQLAKPP